MEYKDIVEKQKALDSTIQPIDFCGVMVYEVRCGLCGKDTTEASMEKADAWLVHHVDEACKVAAFLSKAEELELTMKDVRQLTRGWGRRR